MEKKIDKEYMGNLKEKRRISQIADIDRMLAEMSHGQVDADQPEIQGLILHKEKTYVHTGTKG